MPLPFFSSLRLLCRVFFFIAIFVPSFFFIATFVPSFFLIAKKFRHKSCNDEKKTLHKSRNEEKKGNGTSEPP